jgi:MarR family transcriptional regulator, organic hydroperoxide resistance regulator
VPSFLSARPCQNYSDFVISEIVPESLLLTLQRATHATLAVLAAELSELGLTSSEINVLANLADGRRRTVSALGAAVGSKPTTLTSVLDRLERRGHIVRDAHPDDRRALVVELTPSGSTVAATVRAAVGRVEEMAVWNLPDDAVAGARAVLDAFAELAR